MALDGITKKTFLVIGRVGMDLTPSPINTRTEDATQMMVAMGGSSANMAAVDAVMVKLIQAIPANGIIRDRRQKRGLAAQFAQTRRDVG